MAKNSPRSEHNARVRVFQARQAVHNQQVDRRRRDHLVGIGGAVAAVLVASLAYWGWSVVDQPSEDLLADQDALLEDIGEALDEAEPAAPTGTAPDPALSENRVWEADIVIDGITLGLELDGAAAPQAVANFIQLAQDGYFDNTSCHRLVTAGIFVLQCGDPTGTGTGGPDYRFGPIENAPADDIYPVGTLAMARVGGDGASMGSQFFIVYDQSFIPSDNAGGYTVFGQVTSGLEQLTVDVVGPGVQGGVADGTPVAPAQISTITIR